MQAILHYPASSDSADRLKKQTSQIIADAILCQIKNLPCSQEEKSAVLNAVISRLK